MIVNIEEPYYEFGFGGFQIEYSMIITKTGNEFLVPYGRKFSRIG
jgi:Xaa-Pro aminopeptidase